jgi:putative membrane protein
VLNIAFTVDEFFWDAILGSIIITIVSMILNRVLPDGR